MGEMNLLNYVMVSTIPANVKVRRAYDANRFLIYEGHAPKGSAESDKRWTIRKYTYNVNNQIEEENIAHQVAWDDRETLDYD